LIKRNSIWIYLALLPTFGLIFTFNYWPILSALQHAFYQWDPGGIQQFTGLQNFYRLAHDSIFWKGVQNMLLVMIINSTIKMSVPIIVAVLIFHLRRERARYYYRVMFVIPMIVPGMVAMLIWRYIYSDSGVLDEFLRAVGLGNWIQPWLNSPSISLFSVLAVGFPFVSGFSLLVFYAGLMNIPEAVFDSATLEGVGPFRRFFSIELPLILRQFRVILVLTLLGAAQGYDLFLVLTRGGPGYETIVPGLWMYLHGFSFNEMGYACSVGFVLFLFMLVLTIINFRFIRPRE